MATISTRLQLLGGKEYKAEISAINSEYRNLQAELKAVTAKYTDSAKSTEALTEKSSVLNKQYGLLNEKLKAQTEQLNRVQAAHAKSAQSVEKAKAALEAARKAQDEYQKSGEQSAEKTEEYAAAVRAAEEELAKCELMQTRTSKAVSDFSRQVNSTQAELYDLGHEIDSTNEALNETTEEAPAATDAMRNFVDSMAAEKVAEFAKALFDALSDCAEAAVKFESAFAGVQKTVDGTPEQLKEIEQGIKALSTRMPATANEIAGVAESAGQLGIARENILDFTETMINLGEATNLSAEEAASSLAKFANITGMTADDYERLGSTVVALGNNLATTEADIVSMGMNIASAGKQVGLTEAQIMAMAGALSSVGLEAQAGGTAVSKLMIDMSVAVETGSAKLTEYAEVAGMTAEEFRELFGQDAAAAMSAFFTGLGNGSESAIKTLDEMGVTETRLRDTMLRLASSGDLFADSLQLASAAWEENTALADEANKRYATTESKLAILKNSFENLKIEIGNQFAPALQKAAEAGTELTKWAAQVIQDHPAILNVLTGLTVGIGALAGGIAAVTVATKVIIPLWQTFTATISGGLSLAIAGAVALLTTLTLAFADAKSATEEYAPAAVEAADKLDELVEAGKASAENAEASAKAAESYLARLAELEGQAALTADEQNEYNALVERLQAILPGLNIQISEQTGLIEGGTTALRNQIKAWKDAAVQEAIYTSQKALLAEQAEVVVEMTRNQMELNAAQARMAEIEEEVKPILEDYAKNTLGMSEEAATRFADALGDVEDSSEYTITPMQALTYLSGDLAQEWTNCRDKSNDLSEAIESSESVIADYDVQIEEAAEVLYALGDASRAAGAGVLEGTSDIAAAEQEQAQAIIDSAQQVQTDVETLIADYNTARDAALNMANNVASAFENMSSRTTVSLSEMIGNVQSQAKYWGDYNAALTGALEKVDPSMRDFVLSIADGSEESLGYLQAIAEGSEEDIGTLIQSLKATEAAKAAFVDNLAQMKTNFDQRADEIKRKGQEVLQTFESQSSAWSAAGRNNVQGYIDGMLSKIPELEAAAERVAKAAAAASMAATEQHSPSRLYRRIAMMDFEGYVEGVEASSQKVTAAVTDVMGAATAEARSIDREQSAPTEKPVGGITYVQNNYSPKALDAATIYRQTKSQFAEVQNQ